MGGYDPGALRGEGPQKPGCCAGLFSGAFVALLCCPFSPWISGLSCSGFGLLGSPLGVGPLPATSACQLPPARGEESPRLGARCGPRAVMGASCSRDSGERGEDGQRAPNLCARPRLPSWLTTHLSGRNRRSERMRSSRVAGPSVPKQHFPWPPAEGQAWCVFQNFLRQSRRGPGGRHHTSLLSGQDERQRFQSRCEETHRFGGAEFSTS